MHKNSLDIVFESKLYRSILDKKSKKNNGQFDIRFVKNIEKDLKSSK